MPGVIANTSPLQYLHQAELLDLLIGGCHALKMLPNGIGRNLVLFGKLTCY